MRATTSLPDRPVFGIDGGMHLTRSLTLVALIGSTGCGLSHSGDGNVVDQTRTVSAFSKVAIAGGLPAAITVGPTSVVTRLDSNLQQYVEAIVDNEVLTIRPIKGEGVIPSAGALIHVTNPRIEGIELSGGVVATAQTSSVAILLLEASGGSQLDCSNIRSDKVEIELSGGSTAKLTGQARALKIDASGGSKLTSALPTEDLEINASGGSTVDANASNSITAELSGGSKGTIGGNPSFKVVVTSGGSELSYR